MPSSYASCINNINSLNVSSVGFRTHTHPIHAYTGWGIILLISVKSYGISTIPPAEGRSGIKPKSSLNFFYL